MSGYKVQVVVTYHGNDLVVLNDFRGAYEEILRTLPQY